MAVADALVLVAYFAAVLGVGLWSGRGEADTDDYFLGGRRQPWLVVGLSILATELSALTFIGVPGGAFSGDCSYLQLYFGSFLGRMLIVWLLLPAFYRARVTTVYEYLGGRFGPWTRCTASLLFFVSRVVGSGLRLLAASIAVSVVFDWSLVSVIVGSATLAIAYTAFGGIKAIIWTDALQATVFIGGALAAVVFLFVATPGTVGEHLEAVTAAGKMRVFHWNLDFNDDKAFVVLLIHTLFLNAAVFGTDQDLTQRMLTCSDVRGGQRALTFNALIGLPVVMLFLLLGVMLWAYDRSLGGFLPPGDVSSDRVFPFFIANALPSGWGLRGLLLAGVFAAAMSSLDSALGALSSSAVVDVYRPYIAPGREGRHYLWAGRVFTVAFGFVVTVIAILFAEESDLLWEAFEWASLIFGSLLGVFLLGVTTCHRGHDRINPVVMLSAVGLLAGIKFAQPADAPWIAWPWWIVIGTGWTFLLGALFARPGDGGDAPAACFQSPHGAVPVDVEQVHDDRGLDVSVGAFEQVLGGISGQVGHLAQGAHRSIPQFVAGPGVHVDHQIAVHLADGHHAQRGDHVERHLGGGAGFHARAAGDDLGTGQDADGDVRVVRHLIARHARQEHGLRASFASSADGCVYERRRAAGGGAHDDVAVADFAGVDRSDSPGFDVLRSLDAPVERVPSAGDDTANHFGVGQKRGRAFGSVEHAESATGPGADVDQPSVVSECVGHQLDRSADLRLGPGNRQSDRRILFGDDIEGVSQRQGVDVPRAVVSLFGRQVSSIAGRHDSYRCLMVTFSK